MWKWKAVEKSDNVHEIKASIPRKDGNTFRTLVLADVHFDNPHCDRVLLKKLLRMAAENNWPVVIIGDLFDLMQGRHDPRRSNADMLPEYASRIDYYDAVVADAAEFFAATGAKVALLGYGNHETKVLKHEGTDLLRRFAYRLGNEMGHFPGVGGYGGWLFLNVEDGAWSKRLRVKYHHGWTGGKVSKGTLNTRNGLYLPDADVIISGHIHEEWRVTVNRERVTNTGRIFLDEQLHVCVPTMKEEYGTGARGWHVERGAPPKPVGACYLDVQLLNAQMDTLGEKKRRSNQYRLFPQAIRAR